MSSEERFDAVDDVPAQEDMQDVDEDRQLESALLEYADLLDDDVRDAFLGKLKAEPEFYASMSKALSEMAMLIAGAAVMDDDSEFLKLRKRIMFEARRDDSDMRSMRLYYLNNRHAVEMDQVLSNDAERARFEKRLEAFLADYMAQYPV